MKLFFILGLPRSRTAWLANLLTVPPLSLCYHEGLVDVGGSLPILRQRMLMERGRLVTQREKVTGNSDTGLIHQADELMDYFGDIANFVVVTGAQRYWKQFASKKGFTPEFTEVVIQDFNRAAHLFSDHPRALFIERHELDFPGKVRELWAHCLGDDELFDLTRFELLRGLNVQTDDDELYRRVKLGTPGFTT